MAYCSLEDVYNTLSEAVARKYATDVSTDTDDVIEARIEAAIEKATERVDGYLRSRYTLPLPSVPGIVRDLATDITVYFLVTRKGVKAGTPEENLVKKYDDAVSYLRDIQRGTADIGVITETPEESRPNHVASVRGPTRLFTDDNLRDY